VYEPELLGNPLARAVANRDPQRDAVQPHLFESQADDTCCGFGGDSIAGLGRPDPVADFARTLATRGRPDRDVAEVFVGRLGSADRKVVRPAFDPGCRRVADEPKGISTAVSPVYPRQPPLKLVDRISDAEDERVDISSSERPQFEPWRAARFGRQSSCHRIGPMACRAYPRTMP
jgi:hypothetical protein